jgi:hypothetical protein
MSDESEEELYEETTTGATDAAIVGIRTGESRGLLRNKLIIF